MEGSPGSHTQGRRTLTSFPEMHPGEVVKEQRLSISDLPFYLYSSMQLWGSLGGPAVSLSSATGIQMSTWLSTWLNPKQAIWKSILKTNGRKGRRPIYLSPLPRAIPGWQHPACFLGARGKSSPSQKHLVSPSHRLHPPCKSSSPSTVQKGPGD